MFASKNMNNLAADLSKAASTTLQERIGSSSSAAASPSKSPPGYPLSEMG